MLAWLPSWVGIFSYFMTETLFLPLFLLAVWLFLRYLVDGRQMDLIAFSVVLALSGLCRSISLYSLPVFLVSNRMEPEFG